MSELTDYEQVVKNYGPVLGVEVHVELGTKTKMLDVAPDVFGEDPNTFVAFVLLGLPGCLSVVDKRTVECVIKIDLAPNCEVAKYCRFACKNYFYPDLTKAFQILQSDGPIAHDGYVDVELEDSITFCAETERAHMEEDAGKNTHVGGADDCIHGADYSLMDYDHAGVSPVEIVTRPITGAGERTPGAATAHIQTLRDIFRVLRASETRVERGNARADVNAPLRDTSDSPLGVRSEAKNVNFFRGTTSMVHLEMQRQGAILATGGTVVQETCHSHEEGGSASTDREKSDTEDYRCFPELDLVPLMPAREWVEELQAALPELSVVKRRHLHEERDYADKGMRGVVNTGVLELIEATVEAGTEPRATRKRWMGELSCRTKENESASEDMPITSAWITELQGLIDPDHINDRLTRQVLEGALMGEDSPIEVVGARGLKAVFDENTLRVAVQEAIDANPVVVEKIRGGKVQASGVLVGVVMKTTRSQVDATRVRELAMEMVGV